jgi:hypothetical protein
MPIIHLWSSIILLLIINMSMRLVDIILFKLLYILLTDGLIVFNAVKGKKKQKNYVRCLTTAMIQLYTQEQLDMEHMCNFHSKQ